MKLEKIKQNWYWIVIIVMAIVIFFLWNSTKTLDQKVVDATRKATEHSQNAAYYKELYDSQIKIDEALATSYDSLVLVKNKLIIIENEKIKLVDPYTVSDMQSYFYDRYSTDKKR